MSGPKEKVKDHDIKFEPEQDMTEQIKKMIEKKKRNVEKRKNKLEEYKKKAEKGDKLLPEQAEALANYAGAAETTQTLQVILDQIQQFSTLQARWQKKERKASLKKPKTPQPPLSDAGAAVTAAVQESPKQTPAVVAEPHAASAASVLAPAVAAAPSVDLSAQVKDSLMRQARMFRLLQCFGDEEVRQLFLSGTEQHRTNLSALVKQGLVPIQPTDLEWLDEAYQLLNPLSQLPDSGTISPVDVFGCSATFATRKLDEVLGPAHKHWTSLLLRENAPMLEDGTTFAHVAELADRLLSCEFLANWKPTPPPVAASPVPAHTVQQQQQAPLAAQQGGHGHAFAAAVAAPPPGFSTASETSGGGQRYHTNSIGSVDRMLQTLETPYQFMQHPGTPTQENGPVAAIPTPPSQQHQQPTFQPAPQVASPYWSSNTAAQAAGPPPGLQMSAADTVAPGTADWGQEEEEEEEDHFEGMAPATEHFSLHEEPQSHETRERVPSGAPSGSTGNRPEPAPAAASSAAPINLSWADKVRSSNASGAAAAAGGPCSAKTASSENAGGSFGTPPQHGAGDVFTTASQSQFLGGDMGGGDASGGFRRRGGRGGAGGGYHYGGGEQRPPRGGGGGGYRGQGRGAPGGGGGTRGGGGGHYANTNGQRGGGTGRPAYNQSH